MSALFIGESCWEVLGFFCLDAGGTLEVDAADAADSTKWWADELSTWLKDEEAAA